MLGYIPGLLHAWYIIAKYPDENGYEAIPHHGNEERGGTVTYYYVQQGSGGPRYGTSNQQGQGQGVGQVPLPSQAAHTMNAGAPSQNFGTVRPEEAGQGSSEAGVPPTYAEAVKGDHKVQK
jgi:hypothetical protein